MNGPQVTKKPLKTKAAPWTDEEIETLTRLYKEFQDAVDPVKRIIDQLPVKRQKKRIVEKIMELGLCDDKKKLMKKKIRRGLKEGDAGYLEKASGSDSAMEDSSSDDDEADNNQASDQGNLLKGIVIWLVAMAVRVVEFSNGGYKIRKIFA